MNLGLARVTMRVEPGGAYKSGMRVPVAYKERAKPRGSRIRRRGGRRDGAVLTHAAVPAL